MRKATKKEATTKTKVKKPAKAAMWTAADVALLKKAYKNTPTKELGKTLKRTVASIQAKARALGLKKPVVKKKAVAKKKVAKKKPAAKKKVARKKPARKAVAKKKPAAKKKVAKKPARKAVAKKKPAKKKAVKKAKKR